MGRNALQEIVKLVLLRLLHMLVLFCSVPNQISCFISKKFIKPCQAVGKKFDENQNLVEDILEAAVASITNAHMQENPPVKFGDVPGSDSEKSSPQSRDKVPALVPDYSGKQVCWLFERN